MQKYFWLCFLCSTPVYAIPVVPNFQQGVLQQHVETSSQVVEDIKSYDFRTGYQLTVGGSNVKSDTGNVAPQGWTKVDTLIQGTGTTYVSPNLDNKPNFSIVEQGASFNYFESLESPGLTNFTHIQRTTNIQSVSDSTSTFSQ